MCNDSSSGGVWWLGSLAWESSVSGHVRVAATRVGRVLVRVDASGRLGCAPVDADVSEVIAAAGMTADAGATVGTGSGWQGWVGVVVDGYVVPGPVVDVVSVTAPKLASAARSLGRVWRVRTPDLWETVLAAVVDTTVQSGEAAGEVWQGLACDYGDETTLPDGDVWMACPSPAVVAGLSRRTLTQAGLSIDAARAVSAAASAFLRRAGSWPDRPVALADALGLYARIGDTAAACAACAAIGDYTHHPVTSVLRAAAAVLAPGIDWPDSDSAWLRAWRELTQPHTSAWTVIALAATAPISHRTRAAASPNTEG